MRPRLRVEEEEDDYVWNPETVADFDTRYEEGTRLAESMADWAAEALENSFAAIFIDIFIEPEENDFVLKLRSQKGSFFVIYFGRF